MADQHNLFKNQPLSPYTSWHIGGPAKYFYEPKDLNELAQFLKDWPNEPIFFLGSGSNVLISDAGFPGLIIHTRGTLNNIELLKDNTVRAESGVAISEITKLSIQYGWKDAVFLAGIPGTVGGALAMNAGAYGDEIWNHVIAVETINRNGEIIKRAPSEFQIGYRQADGLNTNKEWFVAATLQFSYTSQEIVREKTKEILAKRRSSQPLTEPNCGSVFRNPPNDYAARLIETCGLKGYRIGDAEVSKKHANFIVNKGQAKAADVIALIELIVNSVFEKHGIELQTEVKIIERSLRSEV